MGEWIIVTETEQHPDDFTGYKYDNAEEMLKAYRKLKRAGKHPIVYARIDTRDINDE